MATLEQLESALVKADAAGNADDARAFAAEIRRLRQATPAPANFGGVRASVDSSAQRAPVNAAQAARMAMSPAQREAAAQRDADNLQTANDRTGSLGQVVNYLDAIQHHAMGLPHGVAQLAGHGLNKLGVVSDETVGKDDAAMRQREQDYQARIAGDVGGAYLGAGIGEVAPWLVGIGELKAAGVLPQLARTKDVSGILAKVRNVAAKTGLLAGEGAAMGAASPVIGDGDYWAQKGAQIGTGAAAGPILSGALAGAGKVAGKVASLRNYLTEEGRDVIAGGRLSKLFGNDLATLAKLKQQSPVPGFVPTPAQALQTPEAIQAERILRNNGQTGPAFAQREALNNQSARNVVAGMAKDDAALEAARQARRDGPGKFWRDNLARGAENGRYGRAQKFLSEFVGSRQMPMAEFKILDEARKIAGQVERGSVTQAEGDAAIRALAPSTRYGKKALDQALGVIDGGMVNPNRLVSELETLAKDTDPVISGSASEALQAIARNQDGQGWVHARVLDGLRENIGGMIAKNTPMGGGGSKAGAVYGPFKAKVVNAIDRAVPGYRANLAAYASASQPINDMEAARSLLDAIDSGGRDALGGAGVNLSSVRQLLAKDNRANFPMSQQARSQIESVMEALQQRSVSNNTIAAAGPGTAADALRGVGLSPLLQRVFGQVSGGVGAAAGGLPGYLAGVAIGEGANAANNAVLRQMGSRASSAPETARLIEEYMRRQQRPPLGLPYSPATALLPYQTTP